MNEKKNLQKENKELQLRLNEAEELLDAIKSGSVDAFITDSNQVFTLKSADHAYRVLIETMNEGAVTLTQEGLIIYCNQSMSRMLATPIESIIGHSMLDFIALDEQEKFKSVLMKSDGEPCRAEFFLKRVDHTFLPVLVSSNFLNLDMPGTCMVVTELTEQKNAQRELKEYHEKLEHLVEERSKELFASEKRYRQLLGTANSIIIRMGYDGKIQFINEYGLKFFGYSAEELVGRDVRVLVPGVEKSTGRDLETFVNQILKHPEQHSHETNENIRKDGEIVWVAWSNKAILDDKGNLSEILTIGNDISQLKKAELTLEHQREMLEGIFENIPVLLVLWDASLQHFSINGYSEEVLGWTSDDANDGDYMAKVYPDEAYRTEVGAYMHSLQPGFHEWIGTAKNGDKIPIAWANIRLSDDSRIGIGLDLRERKQAEEILKRDKEAVENLVNKRTKQLLETHLELERVKRLSDIGVLAATVAHELRNPLAAISLAAHNIKRKVKDENIEKNIASIVRKVYESDQIINNLLFYSRLKPPHFEKVDMNAAIDECVQVFNKEGDKEIAIIKDMSMIHDVVIEADPIQIREVFMNLFNNARDSVSSGTGRIKIRGTVDNGMISIVVSDNGSGISKDILDKIYDPFFTTKAKGTGLGLSVCEHIIKLHDGFMKIESQQGKGTTVTIALPIERRKK